VSFSASGNVFAAAEITSPGMRAKTFSEAIAVYITSTSCWVQDYGRQRVDLDDREASVPGGNLCEAVKRESLL